MAATLDSNFLQYESKNLLQPSLDDVKKVLTSGLTSNFATVSVDVVDCPNLKKAPFHLASEGICGNPLLLEVGGPPYLLPLVDRSKLYDTKSMCKKALPSSELLVIGAGAGPFPHLGTNVEGIFNFKVNADDSVCNNSHVAQVDANLDCHLHKLPPHETRCALLGNLLLSEGKQGKVLKVHCKKRTGNLDFIASIRKCLTEHYKETVGLGGTFLLKEGAAKQHVMRDFSKTPITTEEELNTWLKFYEMPAKLINVGTLVTDEADLDLRLQHFHSFSHEGKWGGHYHNDTTPDTVEYEGYFVVAEKVVRVDKPVITHKFGRD
ncbi:ester hydrolase C11orf54 homolog [Culicoides brevitarsis]|uniref:ester hydrolase C11orf54 homolog n=1 Tax=Culicoides brevitarsis TaxID=469753 RepID=UPI00307B5F50